MAGSRRISIERFADTVTVTLGQRQLARTQSALVLREEGYAPVFYLPPNDVDLTELQPSEHKSHCPYKGDATYLSLVGPDQSVENIAWSYAKPLASVAEIAGQIAFYATKCEISPKLADAPEQA